MTSTIEKQIGKGVYLYDATSKRVGKEVKTIWKYLGPKGKGTRQIVDKHMMCELSALLMEPGLSREELKRIARKYELKTPEDPRLIALENDLLKKKLYVWIK